MTEEQIADKEARKKLKELQELWGISPELEEEAKKLIEYIIASARKAGYLDAMKNISYPEDMGR